MYYLALFMSIWILMYYIVCEQLWVSHIWDSCYSFENTDKSESTKDYWKRITYFFCLYLVSISFLATYGAWNSDYHNRDFSELYITRAKIMLRCNFSPFPLLDISFLQVSRANAVSLRSSRNPDSTAWMALRRTTIRCAILHGL